MSGPLLTVIIPTLDEGEALPGLLTQLAQQRDIAIEVIVADGGSTDGTVDAAIQGGATLVRSGRGRGKQMNAGAHAAKDGWLLFLHADSGFNSDRQLANAVTAMGEPPADDVVAGHFALEFERSTSGAKRLFRWMALKSTTGRPGTINGDQGLLIRKSDFEALGGFDDSLPILEDQRLANLVFERGRWVLLPHRLRTSARRFEREGAYRRYTLMSVMMGFQAAGSYAFFRRAPDVYAAQGDTGRLPVARLLGLTWRVLIDAGWRGALQILYRAGRFSRQNAWQLFLWLDWRLGLASRPMLRFHDRVFTRLTDNAVCDALTAVLISAWFLLVLPLAYAVLDRLARARPAD